MHIAMYCLCTTKLNTSIYFLFLFFLVLTSMGLSHNRIGDEGAQAIADMLRNNSSLEKLSLSANDITDEGGEPLIAALTQNTSLTTLLLAQVTTRSIIVYYKVEFIQLLCQFKFVFHFALIYVNEWICKVC